MKNKLQLNAKPTDVHLTRAESIFNTIINVAKREVAYRNNHEIFALAFGLKNVSTCDLFALLEYVKTLGTNKNDMGYEPLIRLLANHEAPYTREYVEKYLTEEEAGFLYKFYSKNIADLQDLVEKLPTVCKNDEVRKIANAVKPLTNIGLLNKIFDNLDEMEKNATRKQAERAMEHAKAVIHNRTVTKLETMSSPKSISLKNGIELLCEVAGAPSPSNQPSLTTGELTKLVDSIEPHIYGNTPMCKALRSALNVFESNAHNHKFLFLLSDGEATDGSPVQYVQQLRDKNVHVFSCLLSSNNISHPRRLYNDPDPQWTQAQRDMFELSSTIENTHPAMAVLLEQGWELPPAGRSRLFVQANHPDVINEFSSLVRHMAENQDALLNICGRVTLDIYINSAKSSFKPYKQKGGTCYAHAVAAVLHLAMRRIEGREGGVPDFKEIRNILINEYGEKGANTKEVLDKWTSKYRLHYKEVDELGARQALNARRPVVATFRLSEQKWKAFERFYDILRENILRKDILRKDILEKEDLGTDLPLTQEIGHAVVLMKCDPEYLTFMNSWGTDFADDGFFKVRNQAVLNLKFYDVYWTLNDLKRSEIEAFDLKKRKIAEDIAKDIPTTIQNLPYKCPRCQQSSSVKLFTGHLWEATCPKCKQTFKPLPIGLITNSYQN